MSTNSFSPIVYVVEDNEDERSRLEHLLRSVQMQVRSFETAHEFLDVLTADRPAVLVADVRMPGMSGLELQEQLNRMGVRLPIIFMTGFAEVASAVRAMKAGATDFVEKPFSEQGLLDKIQQALNVELERCHEKVRQEEIATRIGLLSPREREVLNLLINGKTAKEICRELGISLTTVDFHKRHVLEKMEVDNVVALVREVARVASELD